MNAPDPRIVARLQDLCIITFVIVSRRLQPGMSEHDIADALRATMAEHGITEHWYDVPFIVLIGGDRFVEGTLTSDYAVKAPSSHVKLSQGDAVHIDFSPMDPSTGAWGDWSTTFVFDPATPHHRDQLDFLEEMRALHGQGIAQITARTTGAQVAQYFMDEFAQRGVELVDVRRNVGHSIHIGPKSRSDRIWLDLANNSPLGPGIFTVEPGGIHRARNVVARFEKCILIPEQGPATILGKDRAVPLMVKPGK